MVLRADTRVKLSKEGLRSFPEQPTNGLLQGYNAPGLARVLFDGLATPIELDDSFIEPEVTLPSRRRASRSEVMARHKARQQEIVERRKLVRQAFDLIRYDPAEKATVNTLARALGGVRGSITPSIMDTARQILADRADQQSEDASK